MTAGLGHGWQADSAGTGGGGWWEPRTSAPHIAGKPRAVSGGVEVYTRRARGRCRGPARFWTRRGAAALRGGVGPYRSGLCSNWPP